MDVKTLLLQLLIALVCAGIATLLIPRKVPGGIAGMILIGLAGEFLGSWTASFLQEQYNLTLPLLEWQILEVPIVPSVIGAAVVLYIVTAFLSWGHYGNR